MVLLATCHDEPHPRVDGLWSGLDDNGTTFSFWLEQDETGAVTGGGALYGRDWTRDVDITGVYVYPDVTLTLDTPHWVPISYQGRMDGPNRIIGELVYFTFTEPLTLHKDRLGE